MRWAVNATGRFTPGKRPCIQGTRGWVGPRTGLDRCGKSRLPPGFDPRQNYMAKKKQSDKPMPSMKCRYWQNTLLIWPWGLWNVLLAYEGYMGTEALTAQSGVFPESWQSPRFARNSKLARALRCKQILATWRYLEIWRHFATSHVVPTSLYFTSILSFHLHLDSRSDTFPTVFELGR